MTADVVLYKGMVMPENLPVFYQDLQRDDLASSIAVFHQRFSTNTLPQWRLAQPFRYLAHNGEINTIRGNRNWARARTQKLTSQLLPELPELSPIVGMSGSDSSSLDNMLEVLLNGGMDIFNAMRLLIPPAWQNNDDLPPDMRAFLQYNSMHMEPWDGPAGIVLTDGRYAACSMDRNGLRPARYVITRDRHITLASEIGVFDYEPEDVVSKGRLRPGQMFAADTETGELLLPREIDQKLAEMQPWARWLRDHSRQLRSRLRDDITNRPPLDRDDLRQHEKMFGLTFEERDQILRVLAEDGQEAIGSMGDDTPYPVMSQLPRSLYDNFRQQFAQVTNPPIDPLRESIVMSLETCLGAEVNLFEAGERGAKRLVVRSPILSRAKFETLRAMADEREYRHAVIDLNYDPSTQSLKDKIDAICKDAIARVRAGDAIIILNDRRLKAGHLPAHALLATGAVHHALIEVGLRCDANIIVATGTARDPHHMACLIGYGATCVYPYLAYESINGMVESGQIDEENIEVRDLEQNYRKGINKGLLKILSKMGISGITSYRGAQLFEIVGLSDDVVGTCFTGTTSRIAGADFDDLQADSAIWAAASEDPNVEPDQGGLLKFIHGGEYHVYNPDVVSTLQAAVTSGNWSDYEAYRDTVNSRPPVLLRDLLALQSDAKPIPLDEVEPVEAILNRFDSAGMSLGALSPEAHETLAEAMNRLGGRSNSGEGGEDPARYGTDKVSKIKQIASGRFGVTPHYLVNAEVLQIKVAQGAKPGEGGQLPGHKVNRMIAKLRHSMPGVALISPPPHHDIYSIEDLAQLIFDLKQVNPDALVSKMLCRPDYDFGLRWGHRRLSADLRKVRGQPLGTRHVRDPSGLARQQVARQGTGTVRRRTENRAGRGEGRGTRGRELRVRHRPDDRDGLQVPAHLSPQQLRHRGRHATQSSAHAPLQRQRRQSHELHALCCRRRAPSARGRSLEDIIGQPHYLIQQDGITPRQAKINLAPVLSDGGIDDAEPRFCTAERNDPFDKGELAERILGDCTAYELKNVDRSIGARLSGEIARHHGNYGMSDAPIDVQFSGTAGQSFGVWNAAGLNLELVGDANDYVGKGMAGGRIVIRPGERFAVRNSGAVAVVEGIGDHGCEYMTGGCIVSLGPTGVNFGAGMTGGMAFVLDQERHFVDRYNHELVEIARIHTEETEAYRHHLLDVLERYVHATHSTWGQEILENFYAFQNQFWLVKPKALELEQLFSTLRRAA